MIYISKGMAKPGTTEKALIINIRGAEHHLSGERAELWLAGQFNLQEYDIQPASLDELIHLGLAEAVDNSSPTGRYDLLTRCIIVPAKLKMFRSTLGQSERQVWQWISKAGLRLTVAELICLAQHQIDPLPQYMGETNRQNLVEAIYTTGTIADNILENLMEYSDRRDDIVSAVFGLLRKKRIILI